MAVMAFYLPALTPLAQGKVRHVYEVDDERLLFVASDRLSAFDVVMNNGVPGKGKVLNEMSTYWMNLLRNIVPNHLITENIDEMPDQVRQYAEQLRGRCQLVRRLKMLPLEVIVRGYLTGSVLQEYQTKGTVCGIPMCKGLVNCSKLPQPLYTPSTKAEEGHDMNINPEAAAELIGKELNDKVAEVAVKLYQAAAEHAAARGIIIADTKFEFGLDADGQLVLADEVLTPDSSRFWPANDYEPGRNQNSYDKQYVRDWLESIAFDKKQPVTLPDDVVNKSREKYMEALELLTMPVEDAGDNIGANITDMAMLGRK